MRKYYRIGDFNNRDLLFHSSEDQKSQIKGPAVLVSSEGSFPGLLSPSCWVLLCPCTHTGGAWLSLFYKDTSPIGLRPDLYDLT